VTPSSVWTPEIKNQCCAEHAGGEKQRGSRNRRKKKGAKKNFCGEEPSVGKTDAIGKKKDKTMGGNRVVRGAIESKVPSPSQEAEQRKEERKKDQKEGGALKRFY